MYVLCACCHSAVYDFVQEQEFKEWMSSLNYFIIYPFLVKKDNHYQFYHDAYDVDGNIIGTYVAPVKLSKTDACKLLLNDKHQFKQAQWEERQFTKEQMEVVLDENRKVIFNTLSEARPSGFPSRDKIETILEYANGQTPSDIERRDWLKTLDHWSKVIYRSQGQDPEYDEVIYGRTLEDIERFEHGR